MDLDSIPAATLDPDITDVEGNTWKNKMLHPIVPASVHCLSQRLTFSSEGGIDNKLFSFLCFSLKMAGHGSFK